MRRGEVYWVNFDPSVGEEIQKKRPAVVVSIDSFNERFNRAQVVPLTSKNTDKVGPSQALVHTPDGPSKALVDQLTTISSVRLGSYFFRISKEDMEAVEDVIRRHLGLP